MFRPVRGERARSGLDQPARAGDHSAVCCGQGRLHGQGGRPQGHVASGKTTDGLVEIVQVQRRTGSEGDRRIDGKDVRHPGSKRPGVDRGRSGVGIRSDEHERAVAALGQSARAGNRAGERERGPGIGQEGSSGRSQAHVLGASEAGRVLQCSSVKRQSPRSQVVVGAYRQGSGVDGRAAGIGARAGEGQDARAGLDQAARAGDDAAVGAGGGRLHGQGGRTQGHGRRLRGPRWSGRSRSSPGWPRRPG